MLSVGTTPANVDTPRHQAAVRKKPPPSSSTERAASSHHSGSIRQQQEHTLVVRAVVRERVTRNRTKGIAQELDGGSKAWHMGTRPVNTKEDDILKPISELEEEQHLEVLQDTFLARQEALRDEHEKRAQDEAGEPEVWESRRLEEEE